MTYAFVLDASACSGCKACQAACKDKNQLPAGVLWRRVYEVSGGGWQREEAAWSNTVFAYNLSLSCNHCIHPKCAGVCPADAYIVRDDGIVVLDSSKCIGCGYCAWACPYGAPQYDRAAGHMTKCDFCYDYLELGLAPACVAACPLRVLDYAEVGDGLALKADQIALWDAPPAEHPYPMPERSRTQPRLAIKPHAAMRSEAAKRIANQEEVRPQRTTGWEEAPLVGFTLLMQMAVGSFWAVLWLFQGVSLPWLPMLLIGLCLGGGVITSFAHLGSKRNAWRVLSHVRKSWLSKEILFTILFGAGWAGTLLSMLAHAGTFLFSGVTALLGVELIHAMSRVYRLPAVPAWNSWRTQARFFLSALLLGSLAMLTAAMWVGRPATAWGAEGPFIMALLVAEAVVLSGPQLLRGSGILQLALLLTGLTVCAVVLIEPGWLGLFSSIFLLVIILAEQAVGRLRFYRARIDR